MTADEFRAWFGSSQAVDPTGEPILVFRGEHGATPVASLDEARSKRTMARATEIIQGMDQQTYDTLQNDSIGNFWSGRRPLPSVLRESFQDWMSEYPGSEGETMMAHENLDETYARFIEELLDAEKDDPGSHEPAVVAMAKSFRDGTGIQGLKQDSSFQTRLGSLSFGSAEAASVYAMEPNDHSDGPAHSPRVVPAYLQINNPLINTPDDCFIDLSRIRALRGEDEARRIAAKFATHIENTGLWQDEYAASHPSIDQFIKSATTEELDALYFNVWVYLDDPDEVALLREAGIDGAIYGGSGANALEPEYRVFSDTQVQNAIEAHWPGRTVRESASRADGVTDSPTETPAFKAWFKDSNVVDAEGRPLVDVEQVLAYVKDIHPDKDDFTREDPEIEPNIKRFKSYRLERLPISELHVALRKFDVLDELVDDYAELETNPLPIVYDSNRKVIVDGMHRTAAAKKRGEESILALVGNSGDFDGAKPDIRYSVQAEDALKAPAKSAQRSALGLYSELSEQIMTSAMKQAPASDWKYFIKGLDKKGVKSDEIKWSGVLDWLELQKENGKVTQEALLTYLETNGVQVRETVIGDGKRPPLGWMGDWSEPDFNGESFVDSVEGWRLVRDSDGRIDIYEDDVLTHEGIDGEGRAKALASESHYGDGDAQSTVTKFSSYVLPGGENYREVLLTLPRKSAWSVVPHPTIAGHFAMRLPNGEYRRNGGDTVSEGTITNWETEEYASYGMKVYAKDQYTSGHWDQSNVLVHIRLNDRVDADGAKVLFVEELQSDWGQEGKRKGFDRKPDTTGWTVAEGAGDPASGPVWEVRDASGRWVLGVPRENAPTKEAAITRAAANRPGAVDPIPSAPFVGATDKWLTLALKRVIGLAVDGGYDKVAFVSGAQSSDRYKLSKQINAVSYNPGTGYYVAQQKDGGSNQIETDVTPEKLASLIGKDVANKLLATELNLNGVHVLRDIDLQTGGEGMQVFYDTIVPNTVSALLKKLNGAKMEPIPMAGAKTADQLAASVYGKGETYRNLPSEPQRRIDDMMREQETEQLGFSITNSLRAKVARGLPLFSQAPAVPTRSKPSSVSKVRRALSALVGEKAVTLSEGIGRLVISTSREIKVPGYPQMPVGALASLSNLANEPAFRKIIADGRAARQRAIAAIGDVGECAIVRSDKSDDRWKMILRDASEPGKWRTQSFDTRGFAGHMSFATRELAIEDAATSGYSVRDDGALDRIQDSPAFQRGLFVTDLLRLVNSREITHREGDRRLAEYDQMAQALHSIAQTGAQAFIAAGGETIYLLADRISEGAEQAVFLHEIVHRHGRSVLGHTGWDRMNLTLKSWSNQPVGSVERLIHDRARARAKAAAGGSSDLFDEEFFAYSVEEAVTMGVKPSAMAHPESAEKWLDTVVTTFERVVSDILNGAPGKPMDAQQVVDMAYALAQIENPARMAQVMARLNPQQRQVLEGVVARTAAPPWYSQLERQVRQQRQDAMPANQWIQWIKAQSGKGVKADEIQWSGVLDWLNLQDGKVSKESVIEYLGANGVRVQETVLEEGDWAVYDGEDNQYFATSREAEAYAREMDINITEDTVFRGTDRKGGYGATYANFKLPGGTNYREVLITLPEREPRNLNEISKEMYGKRFSDLGDDEANRAASAEKREKRERNYKSPHWGQLNVLAHLRVNDRTDADGAKVLFIEEVQSDWGQQGKKKGFGVKDQTPLTKEEDAELMALYDLRANRTPTQTARMHALNDRLNAAQGKPGIPAAPFVTKTEGWLTLALKRVIALAVEGGYEKIAFISGEQSAERYSLAKQVKQVMASKNEDGSFQIFKRDLNGKNIDSGAFASSELKSVVGADLAQKIAAQVKPYEIYENVDLVTGGEGMKVFYDSIVPNAVNSLLKKMGGARMALVDITGVSRYPRAFASQASANEWADKNLGDHDFSVRGLSESEGTYGIYDEYDHKEVMGDSTLSQPGFEVTDAMRETARMGMPLFSLELTAAVAQYAQGTSPDLIEAQAQCAAVVARTIGTAQWMKAPNGQSTKLTQSQWVLVRTENFKRWFGDWEADPENASEAIDGVTREPMVMYHGSPKAGFAEFKPEMRRRGEEPSLFFTSERHVARSYAGTSDKADIQDDQVDEDGYEIEIDPEPGVYAVFLNIRHPHITDFEGANWDGSRNGQWMVADDEGNPIPDASGKQYFHDHEKKLAQALADSIAGSTLTPAMDAYESTNSATREAKRYGCDGALMYDVVDEGHFASGGEVSHVFAVFSADQVKSATDNVGTFDPQSWDIRHSLKDAGLDPFKVWSEDLPVVSTEAGLHHGGPAVFEAFHGTTHANISEFKKQGGKDGFLGEGPYFTTSARDASANYAGIGLDLTQRISNEAELISDNPDDYSMREMLQEYYNAHAHVVPLDGWSDAKTLEAWYQHGDEAARFAATKALKGDSDGFMMKVFVKLTNPADTTDNRQFLTYEYGSDLDDNGDEIESGTLVDWVLAARRVATDYDANIESYVDALLEDREDISMKQVFSLALKHLMETYDQHGDNINAGGFFREIAQEAGFDGIIMDADLHFGSGRFGFGGARIPSMEGVDSGTLHILPFSAEQVKSAIGNSGQFDPQNPDIRFSMSVAPDVASKARRSNIDFKTRVLDLTYGTKGVKRIESDGMLAAVQNKTGRPVFIFNGNFGREQFKQAHAEARLAGIEFDKMHVMAQTATYSGPSISFDRLDSVLPYEPAAPVKDDARKTEQTDTTAFKSWFGESKVVDSIGKPLVVYHGTTGDFSAFGKKGVKPTFTSPQKHLGFFFTDVADMASRYTQNAWSDAKDGGNVMPVYLSMKNPKYEDMAVINEIEDGWTQSRAKAYVALLKQQGYDGIVFEGDTLAFGNAKEYVVFDPTQIKSAIGNSGDFDASKPDIRYSMPVESAPEAATAAPEFQTWFGNSKVVDADGLPLVLYHGSPSEFSSFDPYSSMDGGFYFTENRRLAQSFSKDEDGELGALYEVRLNLQNPKTIDLHGEQQPDQDTMRSLFDEAKSQGHDGVVLMNVKEFNGTGTQYAAFHPDQIRVVNSDAGLDSTKVARTSTLAFNHWFGQSKVVDAEGKPRVVYHGTASDFSVFDKTLVGSNYGLDRKGFFFAGRVEAAEASADDAARVGLWSNPDPVDFGGMDRGDVSFHEEYHDDEPYDYVAEITKNNKGQNVISAYLSIQNPLILNATASRSAGDYLENVVETARAIKMAEDGGHDGIIVHGDYMDIEARNRILARLSQNGWIKTTEAEREVALAKTVERENAIRENDKYYVVFSPEQVKSAIGNNGDFDASKPDIRYSMPAEAVVEAVAAPEPVSSIPKVAQSREQALNHWFGQSKVVADQGRPLVVYHGTAKSFNTFSEKLLGKKTGALDAQTGFFFAENPRAADMFTWEAGSPFDGNIMPVHLRIENPFVVTDLVLDGASGTRAGRIMQKAKADGHDGIIFEQSDMLGHKGRSYAIFSPYQVKSAIGNNGKFDRAKADLRYSMPTEPLTTDVTTLAANAFKAALKPHKDAIYHDLVSTADCGPFDGGCLVFAQALQRVIGGNLVVLTGADDRADHAAVELDGRLYDFDGPLKPAAFKARFAKNEHTEITGCRALAPHDLPEAYRGSALEDAIAAKLRAAFVTQNIAEQAPITQPCAAIPQEHSAAFRRWFERSEVVNEHGNPKVMYHSTVAEFSTFKRSRKDVGIHFGTAGQAEDRFLLKMEKDPYGPALRGIQHSTMPVYLSIKRALRMDDVGIWNRENMISQMPDEFSLEERLAAQTIVQVRDLIKSHGYDGIVYKNNGETGGGALLRAAKQRAWIDLYVASPDGKVCHSPEAKRDPLYVKYAQACRAWHEFRNQNAEDSWIAFEPSQIKSAISNAGAFDVKKANIRYSMPPEVEPETEHPPRLRT